MQRALAGNLPDGALINGVANFYRTTKPLTRVDSSALVIGDRWINPNTGVEGFWNGTYWLSAQEEIALSNAAFGQSAGTATSTAFGGATTKEKVITRIGWVANADSVTGDALNFLTFTYSYLSAGSGATTTIDSFTSTDSTLQLSSIGNYRHFEKSVNLFVGSPLMSFFLRISETGTTGNWGNGTNRSCIYVAMRGVL